MSFFCPKCGTQLPDGANVCSQCGTPIGAPAPVVPQQAAPVAPQQAPVAPQQAYDPNAQYAQQPYPQAPYGAPVAAPAPKQPANFDLNVGGFFGDFFKSPLDAIETRIQQKFWLMAVIFGGAYAILNFIIALIDHKAKPAKWAFASLLTDCFTIAAFAVIILLFASAFKIKKLDFLSSLAFAGLPFVLMFACRLVEYLNTKLYSNIDKKGDFFSISSIIAAIALYFIVVLLYDFAMNANPGAVTKTRALMFALVVIACYLLADKFFYWMFYKIFDLKNAYSYKDSLDSLSDLYAMFG